MMKKMITLFFAIFLLSQSGSVFAMIPTTATVISWSVPEDITLGTALSATQLNATCSTTTGTFYYSPDIGTILEAGTHELTCDFIATNPMMYSSSSSKVNIIVLEDKKPMQLVFTTTDVNQSIALPLYGTVNCTVDWGDESATEDFDSEGSKSHTFATAGTYTVEISGELTTFGRSWREWSGVDYLTAVNSFGDLGLTSLEYAFNGAVSLSYVPASLPASITNLYGTFYSIGMAEIENLDKWDVSNVLNMRFLFGSSPNFNQNLSGWTPNQVTNMSQMFYEASVFNQDIGSWKVDSVTDMSSMFYKASEFNKDISNWKVDRVRNMSNMFYQASDFNQDISSWNVDSVTNMYRMFYRASVFNQDISSWNVDGVTNMSGMFASCSAFDQDLSSWNVSKVTDMSMMFQYASKFNGNISSWDTESVENMKLMFRSAKEFDQNISNWNVKNVTDMTSMFESASIFNQDIGGWQVDSVENMFKMFSSARAFNQDIGAWHVDSVTTMSNMFSFANAFNQDISTWNITKVSDLTQMFFCASAFNQNITSWDVAKVTDMTQLFSNASAFTQNIGSWDISSVTSMENMFQDETLPVAIYDSILIGFAAQEVLDGVTFNGGRGRYSSKAAAARDTLIAHNWTINDGGALEIPVIAWSDLEDIISGTALSATQLNASASVNGAFTYSAVIDSVLNAGSHQMITTVFTPSNTSLYETVSDTVYINVTVTTALASSVLRELVVYPNPVTDGFYVALKGSESSQVMVTLMDASGRVLLRQSKVSGSYISAQDFTPGMYVLYLQAEGQSTIKKLIVK